MSGGARRAIGAAMILVFLVVYVVLAATIGGHLAHAPWWAQLAFYAIAGVAWALPLRPLFVWMGKGR